MKIDYSCPQCGAPIVLSETDRILTCPYCRVSHYLVPEDFFRYYLPPDPGLADPGRILFVPYGRFRGMFFHLLRPAVESRVIDHTFLALNGCFLSQLTRVAPPNTAPAPGPLQSRRKLPDCRSGTFRFPSFSGTKGIRCHNPFPDIRPGRAGLYRRGEKRNLRPFLPAVLHLVRWDLTSSDSNGGAWTPLSAASKRCTLFLEGLFPPGFMP